MVKLASNELFWISEKLMSQGNVLLQWLLQGISQWNSAGQGNVLRQWILQETS